MSVNSKMTAIADKIRALLGISGTMGLDAMATNLGTEQTNIANAFNAISTKGGAVPSSKVSGNLASAINSIPVGATVQKKSGSFTTDTNGYASVTCGFKPDLVYIKGQTATEDGDTYVMSASVAFELEARSGYPDVFLLQPSTGGNTQRVYDMSFEAQTAGFTTYVYYYNSSWSSNAASRQTFEYIAVKYT